MLSVYINLIPLYKIDVNEVAKSKNLNSEERKGVLFGQLKGLSVKRFIRNSLWYFEDDLKLTIAQCMHSLHLKKMRWWTKATTVLAL